MSEVKIYRVEGYMLISHDKVPTWQKFVKEVRAINEKQALDYVYSIIGSNHKVRRKQIRVVSIREIPVEETRDKRVSEITRVERFVKIE